MTFEFSKTWPPVTAFLDEREPDSTGYGKNMRFLSA